MYRILLIAVGMLLLNACRSKQNQGLADYFSEQIPLSLVMLPTSSLATGLPVELYALDEDRLAIRLFSGDYLYYMVDAGQGTLLYKFAVRGKGPGEILSASNLFMENGSMGCFDLSSLRIIRYDNVPMSQTDYVLLPDRTIHVEKPIEVRFAFFSVSIGSDYLLECVTEDGKRFARIDSLGQNWRFFEGYGERALSFEGERWKEMGNYYGNMDLVDSVLFHCSLMRDEISFYQLMPNGDLKLFKRYEDYEPPVPDPAFGRPNVLSQAASSKSFYALYSGIPYSRSNLQSRADKVLVFDRAGNPVRTLNLSVPLRAIAVSPSGSYLYGLGEDPETLEPKLYKAKLNE